MDGPRLLRAWRELHKRTQTECSASVGVRQSTWNDWEFGKKSPQVKYAGRITKLTDGAVPMMAWSDDFVSKKASAKAAAHHADGTSTCPCCEALEEVRRVVSKVSGG